MSARAENRYRAFAAREAEARSPSLTTLFLRDLNELPKLEGAQAPWGDIIFAQGHGGWWAECPVTGFGYWYRTLREAVKSWRVTVVMDGNKMMGVTHHGRA